MIPSSYERREKNTKRRIKSSTPQTRAPITRYLHNIGHIALLILLTAGFSVASFAAEKEGDLRREPILYSKVLWFDVLQSKKFANHVEETIKEVIWELTLADSRNQTRYFKRLFPLGHNIYRDRHILISRTPKAKLVGEGKKIKFILPFYLFLQDNPVDVVTLRIALLWAERFTDDPQKRYAMCRQFLNLKPSTAAFVGVPDYIKQLRGKPNIRIEDFIEYSDIKNMKLRFRILTDQQGLMVPVDRETRLIKLLDGDPKIYPTVHIPLERLLNPIELKMIKNLIYKIKESEQSRKDYVEVGEMVVGLLMWIFIDRKAKNIKSAWVRRPTRFLLFLPGIFVFDYLAKKAEGEIGIKKSLNSGNVKKRKEYQDIFLKLTDGMEKAKIGSLNVKEFKKEICFSMGIRYSTAKDIYLIGDELKVLDRVEKDFQEYIKTRKKKIKKNLVIIYDWMERLSKAKKYVDRKNGLRYYILPPRKVTDVEKMGDTALKAGAVVVAGEFLLKKLRRTKTALRTGKIFGGIAISSLAVDIMLGVTAADKMKLYEDKMYLFRRDLIAVERHLIKVLRSYGLLLSTPKLKSQK